MSEHKLEHGKTIIKRLNSLGWILGYHCKSEHPVNIETQSAVDVAWLYEAEHKYPLFIFEIESSTTNSIFANPSKVLATRNYENPLFFFHLLLKGGQESDKIDHLLNLFGTHNYRIYRFSLEEEVNLIKDILTQHRRLTNSLDIYSLAIELAENWSNINISEILLHVENLGFEKDTGNIIPTYAYLSIDDGLYKSHYLRKLEEKYNDAELIYKVEKYPTYIGHVWSIPIHLGLLALFNPHSKSRYFEAFIDWQENYADSKMRMIGAYFGLSQDYDIFLLCISGGFLGLLSTLFQKSNTAKEYVLNILFDIFTKSENIDFNITFYNALWILHICPDNKKGKSIYRRIQQYINLNGGIPKEFLYNPPLTCDDFYSGDNNLNNYERIEIPNWNDFITNRKETRDIDYIYTYTINCLLEKNNQMKHPLTCN